MKSCQDYLSELRQNLAVAEDHLRFEKKNLYKAHELFTEEKDKWAAEIREDERKIHSNEIQIKEKTAELEQLKISYEEVGKKCARLQEENEKIKIDIQKAKREMETKRNWFLLEQGHLEKELSKVQEQMKDLKVSNKWAKVFQEKELKAHEADEEDRFKEELKEMKDVFAKKIEAFQENLKDMEKAILGPKKQRLDSLKDILDNLTKECNEMEEKNRALEKQIEMLEQK